MADIVCSGSYGGFSLAILWPGRSGKLGLALLRIGRLSSGEADKISWAWTQCGLVYRGRSGELGYEMKRKLVVSRGVVRCGRLGMVSVVVVA